jgi:isoleucyl-tRNA synthetase
VNGNLVSDGGQFTSFAGEQLQGLDVLSEGTSTVVKMLKENGSLLAENQNYIHRYPYDWRTNRPVIVRAMEQWFTNLDGGLLRRADKSLDSVQTIPEMGKSRLRSVVNARSEWCISRQRSWGVPIPAWQNINTEETILTPEMAEHLASVVETHSKGTDCWWELSNEELLPPSMKSQASEFRRMTDTLDVWFDSGVSWSSVVKSRLGTDNVPADVYLEGSDQHRGWFQSSLLTSSAINNRAPFKTLISHGFVVDANGRKMSKSLGNVVSPQKLVSGDLDDGVKNKKKNKKKKVVIGVNGDPVGADVLRVWAATSNYTKDVAIGDVQIQKASDSLRKIRNVARFLLGNTNDFVHHDSSLNCLKLRPIDRYILSLLRKTTRNTFEAYESYNFGLGFRELLDFVNNDMSSFYLDSCKDLLYADPVDSERRRAAQFTMSEALRKITLCVSPVAVFTAEDIFEHTPNTLWSRNEGIDSVFQHTISLDNNNDDADVDFTMWNEIRQIRGAANRVLENARRRGEIGSSLEGAMSLRFEDLDQISKQLDFARHLDGAADVFSVSQTEFLAGDGSNIFSSTTDGIVGGGEILGIETVETSAGSAEITVTKALGSQCHRCWKHCESVSLYGDDSDGGCVCSRCRDALS